MKLLDVNVLIYLFHSDFPQHQKVRSVIEQWIKRKESLALDYLVMLGYLRLSTLPKLFKHPNKIEDSLHNLDALLNLSHVEIVKPGIAFKGIFTGLCKKSHAKGNLLNDVYLAALALEYDYELISSDADFALIPGLRWIDPLK